MIIPSHIISTVSDSRFAATVGFFDGLHTGHRFLLKELKIKAKKRGLKTMVVTFKEHPQITLNKNFKPQLLTSHKEKLAYLKEIGIDEIIDLDFTHDIANFTAEQFIKNILFKNLHVHFLLVGHDHRFGKDRTEGFLEYQNYGKEIGIEVQQASRYSTNKLQSISSTDIRKALKIGEIEKANALLGRPYSFTGQVIGGFKVGRKIGFPTANLKLNEPNKLIPPIAVYAVEIEWKNQVYKGMMNIGKRPTINNSTDISLEVHIIDFNQDIYDQNLKVSFLKKIREEQKFNSIDELISQLKLDKEFVLREI